MGGAATGGAATTPGQRAEMVRLRAQGERYAEIAARLGCSRWTVGRWVRAAAAGGEAAPAPAAKPRAPHPQTTPAAVQARIRAIRERHPGWGARLIRRRLELDGVPAPPSEVTIHRWLGRWGLPLVRPPRGQPLGGAGPPPAGAAPVWQLDFKQKGGRGT